MMASDHSSIVTCSSFGLGREQKWPGFFFCSECRLYDEMIDCGQSKRINRNSRRHRCHVKNSSINAPRASNNKWCYDKVSNKNDTCEAESNTSTNISMQTVNNECIMKHNRWSPYAKYANGIETISKENKILLKSNRQYRNKKEHSLVNCSEINPTLATYIKYQVGCIVNTCPFNKYCPKRIRIEISDAILSQ